MGKIHVLAKSCLPPLWIILLGCNSLFSVVASTPFFRAVVNENPIPCDKSRKILTAPYGEITDGPSGLNYTQDSHCLWLIKAANNSQFITLKFHSISTECSYDYIYVYDGDSFNSTLLGSFSGRTEPQNLVASSGSMLILLYSDTNYVLGGFSATYYISNCLNHCHNHGKCVGHQCVCHGEWAGPDCEDEVCPDKCGEPFGRGKCVKGVCRCNETFSGRQCDLSSSPQGGNWRWLSTDAEGLTARAAHTSIYLEEQDALYVFGGYDLNNIIDSLQVYRFSTSHWEDEWGIQLQNRHHTYHPHKIDNTLLKAVLTNKNDEEARLWGLKSDKSFFTSILRTLAESNLHQNQRKSRSPLTPVNITEEEIVDILDDILENVTDNKPSPRFGHAAENVPGGFVIYGGQLEDGSLSDELWFYNVTETGGEWIRRATNSSFKPPALARHTLTLAEDYLYLFGGSMESGEFSSSIYRLKLNHTNLQSEFWEEIHPRGGKVLNIRLAAHSTVYYKYTNSLVVFGGIHTNVARFSKLSDRIFIFQLDKLFWTEIHYPRTALKDINIPHERAYHTATISGNYMIVFGGYTHRHNKDEICYDNHMYWYHLGCHIWINQDVYRDTKYYPKTQGVFAHSASLRKGNTLLITGGYHGNVNSDLFAYELPQILRVHDPYNYSPENYCRLHGSHTSCLSDPECGWCSADNSCYGRTIGANCTTNLQITRCPGICPSLTDCHSCLIHGTEWAGETKSYSVASKLGLNQCNWCVQNSRCHHKDDTYGICGEDTPSTNPGWWGEQGKEIESVQECSKYDIRPGMTFIKYNHPVNFSQPDFVQIINSTIVSFSAPLANTQTDHGFGGEMIGRFVGFIRPQPKEIELQTDFQFCVSQASAALRLGSEEEGEYFNMTTQPFLCKSVQPSDDRFLIDFRAKRRVGLGSLYSNHHKTQMELQHITHGSAKPYSFEYLEPFSEGKCQEYKNCLHCMTDALCGWCSLTSLCLPRTANESIFCVNDQNWNYLTIQAEQCSNCSDYINCKDCLESSECEWWVDDAKCERVGRAALAVKSIDKCPVPCKERQGCSECLDQGGRCVWCESSQKCFSFSAYTSEFQFGMCREWYDQVVPRINSGPGQNTTHLASEKKPQCKSCSYFNDCASCLKALNCGWCYDSENPIKGKCVAGDFSNPVQTCNSVLNTTHLTAEWAYAQCPDVDECNLNIHHCHKEAKCTNTHGSYTCQCRKGYVGDGRISCIRTCYETCIKGKCSNSPNYECICDLGWTGKDCSIDCGCNNHSHCEKVGVCESCQDWTEGEHCERCRPGSYGNATTSEGCSPCECNGHGNQNLGVCDSRTGHCFCQDNTDGLKCEKCQKNYYGDPKNGGTCYYQCESRGYFTGLEKKSFGSFHSFKNPWSDHEVHECLWAVSPANVSGSVLITLEIDWSSMNVNCEENAAYVYDGQPDLLGQYPQSQLVGVICEPYTVQRPIETRSGHMTVYFKQTGKTKDGFNAHYSIKSCEKSFKEKCICPGTKIGPKCKESVCPEECNYKQQHGYCDMDYGRCICYNGWGGNGCETRIQSHQLISQTLFNTANLYDQLEHLRITIPRFGHSLSADKRGSLWMFGGYSLPNGPLNDMRLYDTKNGSWLQVTVESAPNDKMPLGRYFHSSDIHLTRQTIYIFGGMTNNGRNKPNLILDDFWQFSIQNQRWDEVEVLSKEKPPQLAGHTLNFIKVMDHEYLLLIGGISLNISNHLQLWMYDLDTSKWERLRTTGTRVPPLYGHSTVFHQPTGIVYVFGGYTHEPQNKLYALDINVQTWTELPVFTELNRLENNLPRARYFHSAVTTDQYMIVYGGRTYPYNQTDVLNAYVYQCNQWIRLGEDVDVIGTLPTGTYAEAVAMDQETKSIYVSGGWNGGANSLLTRISIPEDICRLWSKGKYMCRHYMGCSFCTIKNERDPKTYCVSEDQQDVCKTQGNITVAFNKGATCDDEWISRRNCSTFKTCSSCLASWPSHSETTPSPVCQWCEREDCVSSCVPAGTDCAQDYNWCQKHTSVGLLQQCPQPKCHILKCEECFEAENCEWVINDLGTTQCISKDSIQKHDYKILGKCPEPCDSFTTCSTCLDVESENPKNCRWSTQLNACIYPNLNQIYCAFGVCGLVLDSKNIDHCPEPCSTHTQCSSCLSHAHCAWCGRNNTNGDGLCTEEFPEHYTDFLPEAACEKMYSQASNITGEKFSWNYMECPAEDECANGHHNCNPKSEKCVDEAHGYRCICGEGYKDENGECVPVCRDGCVRGQCIEPDHCLCDFGYVGTNCSIQCQCNGHSDCKGPDRLDDCIKCHNNTMGEQCEKCQPLFVGNPKDGRSCIPCEDYCYGHTDICISPDSDPAFFNMSKIDLEKNLKEGPLENATCLRCSNYTAGARCDTCLLGYFRPTLDYHKSCMKCQCHGHGDICDPSNGEKCNCGNNTESDGTCTAGGGRNSVQQCWKVQCSKCRDSYVGNPTEGHQCYKQITVESRMCFDAKPIEECKVKPSPLRPGQTVFFVVSPRFMNVDIRILIDVTQGELDVFMSPLDDSFIVETNQSTGHHNILLDNRYYWEPYSTIPLNVAQPRFSLNYTKRPLTYPSMANDCKSLIEYGFHVQDHRAKDLSTFVTLHRCNTLLRVFALRNRLVLTLPQNAHNLSATKFYIALRASGVFDHSYGSIVFRQDQLHIDLFVFFSVFFSCFFLFLAICVVAWKAKQASDLRRARRRHVVELLHMAKRPFSTIYVSVNPELETPGPLRRRGRSKSMAISGNDIRLITIEPTSDNIAAIGTILISLPGKYECPNTLTLGSALITLPRQYPLNTRITRRRRGSNIQTTSHSHPPLNAPQVQDNVAGGPVVVVEPQPLPNPHLQ